MFSIFRMFFDWKKLKEDISEEGAMYCAAVKRHEVATNSLTNLLCDIQQHGPIVEKPTFPVEPIFKLTH